MEFAYLDESGDLGAAGSKYLIMAVLCTSRKKELCSIVKHIKERLLRSKKGSKVLQKQGGEIKFHNFPDDVVLEWALKELSKIPMTVYFTALKKEGKSLEQNLKPQILGRVFHHMYAKHDGKNDFQKIFADGGFLNSEKTNCFALQKYERRPVTLSGQSDVEVKKSEIEVVFSRVEPTDCEKLKATGKIVITVDHIDSKHMAELQALDLICGSIFQFFENDQKKYRDLLANGNIEFIGSELTPSEIKISK